MRKESGLVPTFEENMKLGDIRVDAAFYLQLPKFGTAKPQIPPRQ